MHTNDHNKIDPDVLAQMKYETRDLNIEAIGKVAAWFVGFTLFGVFLSWVFFKIPGVVPKDSAPDRPKAAISAPAGTPILQNNINNTEDITEVRNKEKAIMESTGPAADAGFYHIPIADSMKLIAQRGLPTSATPGPVATPTSPSNAAAVPGKPSVGLQTPVPSGRPGSAPAAPAVVAGGRPGSSAAPTSAVPSSTAPKPQNLGGQKP